MSLSLKKLSGFNGVEGPVFVVVMDGIGIGKQNEGNAVYMANTPNLDRLMIKCPNLAIGAHGIAVGMASDADMGNSEVGHNAIGCGRVFDQGAKLVKNSIDEGSLFQGECWSKVIQNCKDNRSALHLIGLLSDGNVHSHIDHTIALLKNAKSQDIKKAYVHILLDGRDVSETSALEYIEKLESVLAELSDSDSCYKIASGGGRMKITMDRYGAEWSMVEKGWHTHTLGEGRSFDNAKQAIETFRDETPGLIDQDLPAFVISSDGKAVGTINDGDSVVLTNYRGDRAIEISLAFTDADFNQFDRKRFPKVFYAGMMQYDGDLKIPNNFLVDPPAIKETMGEYLADGGLSQYAISETQKFGHVTYFWNGNRSGYFDEKIETYQEIPSDVLPSFAERPWMKAAEIAEATMKQLSTGKYKFGRLNFANGDMVGHTGDLNATRIAVEVTDQQLGRFLKIVDQLKGVAIITADHGNADEMIEMDKAGNLKKKEDGSFKAKTSHTLNPVPFIVYDGSGKLKVSIDSSVAKPGLSNIAASCFNLMGYAAPEGYDASLLKLK
ncbi:MAG: phosphoglycerate mutase (2,3-diphosphoglycerate-independent) [Planctomycetota bacterium]|nr:MAG: phosphoglycerate mutase (2,3-diphosphoglycerate-independent) [Planctomycetota bacterium]